MATQAKPTLHEIAAMPYPASEQAMRKHYDPMWGRLSKDGELRTFKVKVRYHFTGSDTWETEVEAATKEDAERIAEDEFDNADLDLPIDCEVDDADFEVTEA